MAQTNKISNPYSYVKAKVKTRLSKRFYSSLQTKSGSVRSKSAEVSKDSTNIIDISFEGKEVKQQEVVKTEEEVKKEHFQKYLRQPLQQSIEQYLLDTIARFSPKLLKQISLIKPEDKVLELGDLEKVSICFMQLVNLIIYERTELIPSWENM